MRLETVLTRYTNKQPTIAVSAEKCSANLLTSRVPGNATNCVTKSAIKYRMN